MGNITPKEAIANLNHIYGIVSPDIQRSLDVAIKALERPTGDCISREVINSEIEIRYCSKHCALPFGEPYCPDSCPARFLKNIVKECPSVPQVTVFTESTDEKAIEDMKAELQSVIESRPQGEWIEYNATGKKQYMCSKCSMKEKNPKIARYCYWCGAKMKGGAE